MYDLDQYLPLLPRLAFSIENFTVEGINSANVNATTSGYNHPLTQNGAMTVITHSPILVFFRQMLLTSLLMLPEEGE
jgi:hypothetical protein